MVTYEHAGDSFWSRFAQWAMLFALAGLLVWAVFPGFLHSFDAPPPPNAAPNGGCPRYPDDGNWAVAPAMNPAIPAPGGHVPRTVRLVQTDFHYDTLGLIPQEDLELPKDWSADPPTASELTVCGYVQSKGPKLEGCNYHWEALPGAEPRREPTYDPPTITLYRSRFLFRVHDTRTGALRGSFALDAPLSQCPLTAAASIDAAAHVDNRSLRDWVSAYR